MKRSYSTSYIAFLLFSSLVLMACSQSHEDELDPGFNYDEGSGRGPSSWGSLKPEWSNCSNGQQQSPIDISTTRLRPELGNLQWNYSPAPAVLENGVVEIAVIWKGNAGSITINRTVYKVDNCHWHSPSEHTINGTRYDLELHIVHRGAQNKTAVVAILYRIGLPDLFLVRLFPFLKTIGNGKRQLGPVNPTETIGSISRNYYRYMGSLTTPPCSQGVVWTVYQQVKTVSKDQLAALRNPLPLENRNNSRPTQPLNGRTVFLYKRHKY